MLQQDNLREWLTTSSNGRDALISGIVGLGDALNGSHYTPYVMSNWAGNGLARSGIGYMQNPRYRDYASAGQALAALGSMGRDNNNLLSGLGSLNKRRELYGSVADSIDKYARPTQYDMYSNNYGYTDNNYSTPISRGITNYFNGVPDNNSIQGVLYNDRPKTPSSIWNDYLR
jgi:hypothetical protein